MRRIMSQATNKEVGFSSQQHFQYAIHRLFQDPYEENVWSQFSQRPGKHLVLANLPKEIHSSILHLFPPIF